MRTTPLPALALSGFVLLTPFAVSQEPAPRGEAAGKMSEADKEWAKPWDVVFDYDVPPKPIKITRPQYPRAAFERKVQGTVVIRILIDAEGNIPHDRAQVLNSIPGLDEAALDCIRAWKFTPAQKNGQPVATMARAPVGFRIFGEDAKSMRVGAPSFESQHVDFTSWLSQFEVKVHAHWSAPRTQDPDLRGHVDLEFVVEHDGKVSDVKTVKSSGTIDLDTSAMKALRATRFPHLPAAYKPERITMHVSFSFNEGEPPPQAQP